MNRFADIDFVKCVCITLMVVMHLQLIGDSYPIAKAMVYTFHMPLFLFLSGYLLNTDRDVKSFLSKYLWILIPYLVMETGYAVASSFLQVRGGLPSLSVGSLLKALLLHPVGPYWYLHTFMLCSTVSFFTFKSAAWALPKRTGSTFGIPLLPLLATALLFFAADQAGLVHLPYAFYFFTGIVVKQTGLRFARLFRPGFIALIPLVLLFCFSACRRADSPGGFIICYCMLSVLLALYPLLPARLTRLTGYIGRHTLSILLFSPIFTLAAKSLIPLFRFDPTHLTFMLTATLLAIGGSLAIENILYRTGFSRYFFGR